MPQSLGFVGRVARWCVDHRRRVLVASVVLLVAALVATTGRVITAAATIMVCVFLAFVLLPERQVKMFGLSLASAVFLDAFVVRSLLLPGVLELLGRRTWWFPERLARRLPHLATEPAARRTLEPTEAA